MRWNSTHGYTHGRAPTRKMIAEDLGLSLLESPWDPELLKVGIQAPKLTRQQRNANLGRAIGVIMKGVPKPKSAETKKLRYFMKTAAGHKTKREISAILQRIRWAGEYRK